MVSTFLNFPIIQNLNYADVKPFVEKYFTPSISIREQVKRLERGLPWQYQSICGMRYRGTDKKVETNQPSYAELVLKAVKLKRKVPQLNFLIQSDEQDFLEYATRRLGNDFPIRNIEQYWKN